MTVELAQDVLKDVFPQGEAAAVSIKRIQELVSERFSLSLDELCGDKRSQNIVYPRQCSVSEDSPWSGDHDELLRVGAAR
jgi:chromosomal replication initiator protein